MESSRKEQLSDCAAVEPIRWTDEGVVMLDQRRLPGEVVYHTYTDYRDVAKAIKDMVIRGAPAIGIAAAHGRGARRRTFPSCRRFPELRAEFAAICDTLARTRPTAVDLFWAIDRFKKRFEELAAGGGKRWRSRARGNPQVADPGSAGSA